MSPNRGNLVALSYRSQCEDCKDNIGMPLEPCCGITWRISPSYWSRVVSVQKWLFHKGNIRRIEFLGAIRRVLRLHKVPPGQLLPVDAVGIKSMKDFFFFV